MHRTKIFNSAGAGIVSRLAKRVHRHFVHASARRHLTALDEHLLHDLGISRSDIDHVIRDGRPGSHPAKIKDVGDKDLLKRVDVSRFLGGEANPLRRKAR